MTRAVSHETPSRRVESSPVPVGERVAGKYVVERVLAGGGMGVVVAARHEALDTRVAIKFLRAGTLTEPMAARFRREARAAASLASPFVARAFDYGTLDSGEPYMVMELLEGDDLAQELKTRGRLPIEEAVDVAVMALAGIGEAHAHGIVHRDLKPSNLFLVAARPGLARQVKVLDFGISKLVESEPLDDDLTSTTAILGSPRYMSPEQAESSKTVDARTDIWSLGVILYQMLSGTPPFRGDTLGQILTRVLSHRPAPLRDAQPEVPAALDEIVARCLERDRDRRFASAAELAQALVPFASARAAAWIEPVRGPVAPPPPSDRPPAPSPPRAPSQTVELHPSPSPTATPGPIEPSRPTAARGGRAAITALVIALGITAVIAWQARTDRAGALDVSAASATATPAPPSTGTTAVVPPTVAPTPETTRAAGSSSPPEPREPAPSASAARPPARAAAPARPPPTPRRPKTDVLGRSD